MENYPSFQFGEKLLKLAQRAEERAAGQFRRIEETARWNSQKMLAAFQRARVSESSFVGSTGYGYGDRGRDSWTRSTPMPLGQRTLWCGITLSAVPTP